MKMKRNITTLILISSLVGSLSIQAADIGGTTGSLVFTTTVAPACGIISPEVDNHKGGINFLGEELAKDAKFKVLSNTQAGKADVLFNNIVTSDNITGLGGSFKINDTDMFWNTNSLSIEVENAEEQLVSAYIPKAANEIKAGEASVSTTITITCK
jgi:hypothetical protein